MPVLVFQCLPHPQSTMLSPSFLARCLFCQSLSSSSLLGLWSGIWMPYLCHAMPGPIINPWERDESQLFTFMGWWFPWNHLLCSQEGQRDVAKLMLWRGSGPGEAVLVRGSGGWRPCWSLAGTAKDAELEALPKASVNVELACSWDRKMV